jgi:hypothetical protein
MQRQEESPHKVNCAARFPEPAKAPCLQHVVLSYY